MLRKANTDYVCNHCEELIRKGDSYYTNRYTYKKVEHIYRYHNSCYHMRMKIKKLKGSGLTLSDGELSFLTELIGTPKYFSELITTRNRSLVTYYYRQLLQKGVKIYRITLPFGNKKTLYYLEDDREIAFEICFENMGKEEYSHTRKFKKVGMRILGGDKERYHALIEEILLNEKRK